MKKNYSNKKTKKEKEFVDTDKIIIAQSYQPKR